MTDTVSLIRKPVAGDYASFYEGYVAAVETDDILACLIQQRTDILTLLRGVVWEKWEMAYAEGKWSLAEVVLHCIDGERIFAYRALRIARGRPNAAAWF
jgi:hypothetical protein